MPRLLQLRTMLTSLDLDATIEFYGRLGFRCTHTFPPGDAPTWCQVERDGFRLMFSLGEPHDHGDGILHVDAPEMSGSIYLDVDDVDAYFAEIGAGLPGVEWEPTDFAHGQREFAVRDNNGYLLIFGAPV